MLNFFRLSKNFGRRRKGSSECLDPPTLELGEFFLLCQLGKFYHSTKNFLITTKILLSVISRLLDETSTLFIEFSDFQEKPVFQCPPNL